MKKGFGKTLVNDTLDWAKKHSSAMYRWAKRNSPTIFTGLGLVGMGGTVIIACKAAPKCKEVLEEKKEQPNIEKVKTVAAHYWPTALSFTASTVLIICGNRIINKRNIALAASASLAQKELLEWQEASLGTIGKDAFEEIKQSIAEKHVAEVEPANVDIYNADVVDDPVYGPYKDLFYEPITGHLFWFNKEKIKEIENEVNAELLRHDCISLSQIYSRLGIPESEMSQNLVFDIYGGKTNLVKINLYPGKARTGELCWEMSFEKNPTYDCSFRY